MKVDKRGYYQQPAAASSDRALCTLPTLAPRAPNKVKAILVIYVEYQIGRPTSFLGLSPAASQPPLPSSIVRARLGINSWVRLIRQR